MKDSVTKPQNAIESFNHHHHQTRAPLPVSRVRALTTGFQPSRPQSKQTRGAWCASAGARCVRWRPRPSSYQSPQRPLSRQLPKRTKRTIQGRPPRSVSSACALPSARARLSSAQCPRQDRQQTESRSRQARIHGLNRALPRLPWLRRWRPSLPGHHRW